MRRLAGTWVLVAWAASASADAAPPADALEKAIEPRLAAVLAKSKLSLAGLSYQDVAIDATYSTVVKKLKAGKKDCEGAVTKKSCPSREFHVRLKDALDAHSTLDAWFVNDKLYRLEKTLRDLPPWDVGTAASYAAVFKKLVIAKLGAGSVSHPAAAAVALGYPADSSRPPSGAVSLELAQGGAVAIHLRWNGASALQLDHLIARDNPPQDLSDLGGGGGPCDCSAVTVGSTWPQANGHAAYRPPDAYRWSVVSVNKKKCTAVVVDTVGGPLGQGGRGIGGVGDEPTGEATKKGERSTWKCSSFHPVRINPAG